MVFAPGQSGNPGGRSVKMKPFLDMVKAEDIESAYGVIMREIKNPKSKVAMDAAKWLLEMKFGKPKQKMEHAGEEGREIIMKVTYDRS